MPLCEAAGGHGKQAAFAFHPIGCLPDDCEFIRAVVIDVASVSAIPAGPLFRCTIDIAPEASAGAYRLAVIASEGATPLAELVDVADIPGEIAVRQGCGSCGCPGGSPDPLGPIVFEIDGSFEIDGDEIQWRARLGASRQAGTVSGYLAFENAIDGIEGVNVTGDFTGNAVALSTPVGETPGVSLDADLTDGGASGSYTLAERWSGEWDGGFKVLAPRPKVSAAIVAGLSDGVPQEAFVEFAADDIRRATRDLPSSERIAARARLYAERKAGVWLAIAGAGIEILRDYSNLASTFVLIADLDSLKALLERPEVLAVTANTVFTLNALLHPPKVDELFPVCSGIAQCPGDCNGDGRIGIDELVTAVRISLHEIELSVCPSVDADSDGGVAIHELIGSALGARYGCGA